MNQSSGHIIKSGIINVFGSMGYLFCFLQWFWAIMLYFSVIQAIALFIAPKADQQVEQAPRFMLTLPGPLETMIVTAVTIIMVVLTIYVLIRIPVKIVKTSHKIVHQTTAKVTPIAMNAQHKKKTKKLRARITSKLVVAMKVLLIVTPLALTLMSGLLEKQSIDYSIAVIAGGGLACLSVLFFAIQYLLAGLLRMKLSELW